MNITELAQSLKAAAEKASNGPWITFDDDWSDDEDAVITNEARDDSRVSPIAVIKGGGSESYDPSPFYAEQRANAVFIALANPADIRALVEATEKAQTKADVYDMLRDDYGLREKGVGLADFVDWQADRIADLEFRIATVSRGEVLVTVDGLTDCAMSADVGKQESSLHGKAIGNGQSMPSAQPAPVMDERKSFESFMAERFGDSVDRRRARNGDRGYMAWDMVVAWIVWQARAMLQAGNSPAIPDGYVMVPKEPTAKMYDAGDRQMTTKQVWDAMLAAAQQEVEGES